MTDLDNIFNVPFTFSRHCRSGLANYLPDGKCQCHRCRNERGEEVTEETETTAEQQAKVADSKHKEWMSEFLRKRKQL